MKPDKPRPDFPLFAHASGVWAKKISGKLYYFGPWNEWEEAERRYYAHIASSLGSPQSLSVTALAKAYLSFKRDLLRSGELAPRTLAGYEATATYLEETLGGVREVTTLRPLDFQGLRARMADRWGAVSLGNRIQEIRSIFRYAYEAGLIESPIRFGPAFKRPSAKTIRQQRPPSKAFTSAEIHKLLGKATPNLAAMILLGINGGLGNTDLALLPINAIDWQGWLNYPRPKTGVARRIPLWRNTLRALDKAFSQRRPPVRKEDAELFFIGPRGVSYVGGHKGYRVTAEYNRAAKKAKITGHSFYDLRRTFQTVAEGLPDLVAIKYIMGHAPASGDMSATYRQYVEDSRLTAVVNHVHKWLYTSRPKLKVSHGG